MNWSYTPLVPVWPDTVTQVHVGFVTSWVRKLLRLHGRQWGRHCTQLVSLIGALYTACAIQVHVSASRALLENMWQQRRPCQKAGGVVQICVSNMVDPGTQRHNHATMHAFAAASCGFSHPADY